jgi:hypothetical protein
MADGSIPHATKLLSCPNCCHQLRRLSAYWDLRLLKYYHHLISPLASTKHSYLLVCGLVCINSVALLTLHSDHLNGETYILYLSLFFP